MNHYPRHVGDWMTATAHLSEIEEAIYSRMIDQYYAREAPLPADVGAVARLVRASNAQARKAVPAMLKEFFVLEADGWHQKRCDEELAAYHGKAAKAAASAAARWGNRNANAYANASPNAVRTDMRTQSEGNANQNHNQNHGVAAVVDAQGAVDNSAPGKPMGDRSPGKSKAKGNGRGKWWATDEGVMAHGREKQVAPRPGESMPEYKDRLLKLEHGLAQ